MFVLLEHVAAAGVHWDLLVQPSPGAALRSWRLGANPLAAAGPIALERRPDHRALYLDFEGQLSGGRGAVRRLDRGPVEWLSAADTEVRLRCRGAHLCCILEITMDESGAGVLRVRPHGA